MIGLLIQQVVLFAIAIVAGFAVGWRLRVMWAAAREREGAREMDMLRTALSDAQVRRVRMS